MYMLSYSSDPFPIHIQVHFDCSAPSIIYLSICHIHSLSTLPCAPLLAPVSSLLILTYLLTVYKPPVTLSRSSVRILLYPMGPIFLYHPLDWISMSTPTL